MRSSWLPPTSMLPSTMSRAAGRLAGSSRVWSGGHYITDRAGVTSLETWKRRLKGFLPSLQSSQIYGPLYHITGVPGLGCNYLGTCLTTPCLFLNLVAQQRSTPPASQSGAGQWGHIRSGLDIADDVTRPMFLFFFFWSPRRQSTSSTRQAASAERTHRSNQLPRRANPKARPSSTARRPKVPGSERTHETLFLRYDVMVDCDNPPGATTDNGSGSTSRMRYHSRPQTHAVVANWDRQTGQLSSPGGKCEHDQSRPTE